jgi:hypothetical protein
LRSRPNSQDAANKIPVPKRTAERFGDTLLASPPECGMAWQFQVKAAPLDEDLSPHLGNLDWRYGYVLLRGLFWSCVIDTYAAPTLARLLGCRSSCHTRRTVRLGAHDLTTGYPDPIDTPFGIANGRRRVRGRILWADPTHADCKSRPAFGSFHHRPLGVHTWRTGRRHLLAGA